MNKLFTWKSWSTLLFALLAANALAQERANLATIAAALQAEVPRFLCLNENIATGAQPKAEAFTKLAQQGYRSVLSLRVEKEEGFDLAQDRARAEQAGMRYLHLPFSSAAPDTKSIGQFFAAVKEQKNFPMLVYCSSANRVGALWMLYRIVEEDWSEEQALTEATKIGLTRPELKAFVQSYVSQSRRSVEANTLISTALPEIRVRVNTAFKYLGKITFKIRDVAQGERYIFAETKGTAITRLFIAQFESFLPDNALTYNYNFQNALMLSGHRFKHNTFAFSNREAQAENPQGEAALTAAFLREKGFTFEDEWMMSRYVNVPDAERRHELILFYIEAVSSTGKRVADFYAGDEETMLWQKLSKDLSARAMKNFEFLK